MENSTRLEQLQQQRSSSCTGSTLHKSFPQQEQFSGYPSTRNGATLRTGFFSFFNRSKCDNDRNTLPYPSFMGVQSPMTAFLLEVIRMISMTVINALGNAKGRELPLRIPETTNKFLRVSAKPRLIPASAGSAFRPPSLLPRGDDSDEKIARSSGIFSGKRPAIGLAFAALCSLFVLSSTSSFAQGTMNFGANLFEARACELIRVDDGFANSWSGATNWNVTANPLFATGATVTISSVGNGLQFSTDGLTYSNSISSISATGGTISFQNIYVRGGLGSYTVQLTSANYFATSATLVVSAGIPTQLRFTEMIADGIAGADLQTTTASTNIVVELLDCSGNHANVTGNVVTLGSTPSGVTSATSIMVASVGGYATFTGLRLNTTGTYTLTATSSSVSSTTSNAFAINPGAPVSTALISGPSVMQAGVTNATPFVANLYDGFGNLATNANVSLTLTTSAAVVGLGGNIALTSQGQATFANFTICAIAGSDYNMQVTGASLIGNTTSQTLTVIAGPPVANTGLVFLTQPTTTGVGSILQGTNGNVSVRLTDCAGNLSTSGSYIVYLDEFSGQMRFGTAGDCDSFTSLIATTASVNGIAEFPTASPSAQAGFSYFLFAHTTTASGTTLTSQFSSVSFPLVAGTGATLTYSVAPTSHTAGLNNVANTTGTIVEVRVRDCFGNVVTTTGSFDVTISSAPGGLTGTTLVTGTNGIATFTSLTITTSGSYTLTAASAGLTSTSANISITPAPPTKLRFTEQPGTAVIGGVIPGVTMANVIVDVLDAFNNISPELGGRTIAIASTPAGLTLTNNIVTTSTGTAAFSALTVTGTTGTYQLIASSNSPSGIASATSNNFNVVAGSPDHLTFNIQPSTTCNGGTLNNFSISMRDAYNNVIVTSGSFTVNLGVTGTSVGAVVSPNTAFGNAGTTGSISGYTFTASFAGLYAITATTNYAGVTLSGTSATFIFDVQLIDINDPTIPAIVCVNPMGAIQYGLFDRCVQPLPMTSATITATLSGPTTAVTGNVTTATNNWNGFFTNLRITDPVPGLYTLTFTTATYTSATVSTSSSFVVDAVQMAFTTQPATSCVSTVLPDFVIELRDNCGSVIHTNATVSIFANGGATLTPNQVSAVNGVATFSGVTFMTSTTGSYYITATAANWSGTTLMVSSNSFTVDANHIDFAGPVPTAIPCGTTTNFVATFRDNCENLVTSTSGNITVSIDNGGMLNGGSSVTVASVGGVANFNGVMVNGVVGTTYTLTATALSTTGATITGTTTITITPGVPASIVFSVEPSTTGIAGVNLSTTPQISVLDACGNVVPTAVYQVSYSLDPASTNTTATMNIQPTNGLVTVNGSSTFTGLNIERTGTYYLRAVANFVSYTPPVGYGPAPTQLSATSSSVVILPNVAYKLSVVANPPSTNLSNTFFTTATVVEVQDQFGNQVTTESGRTISMAIASGTPGATLSGTTSTTTVSGVATFSALKIDKVGTYTLSANASGLTSATTTAFDVISGPAVQLSYTFQPTPSQNITSASQFVVTVRTEDAGGNYISTNATIGIQIGYNGGTYTSGTLTVSGSNPVVSTNGIATFIVSIDKIGQYTLLATGSSVTTTGTQTLLSTTSSLFNIVAGTPVKLAIINEPSNGMAGVALATQPYIQIQDAGGNPVTGGAADLNATIIGNETIQINSTVIFTPTPPYTTVSTPMMFSVNQNPILTGVTGEGGYSGLTFYTAGIYQIVIEHNNIDAGPTFATATSASFTIVPNTANTTTSYVVQPTTTVTVGTATNFDVFLRDAWNNRTTMGTISAALTYGDGNLSTTAITGVTSATVVYTAGTDATIDPPVGAADAQINLTIGGVDITGPLGTSSSPIFYDQLPDVPNATTSTIVASSTSAVVGGNAVALTVSARDLFGNPTTLATIFVDVTNGGGTLANGSTGVTFAGSTRATLAGQFTYTLNYLTGTNASLNGVINAAVSNYIGAGGGTHIVGSPVIIDQIPSTVAVISTISSSTSAVVVGGIAGNMNSCGQPTTATVTVTSVDEFGNPTTTGVINVALTQGGGRLTNGGSGVVISGGNSAVLSGQTAYTFNYQSGTNASINAIITAVTSTGSSLAGSPLTIVQEPGVATTATSTIATTSTELEANGTATAFIVMQLRDIYNNTTASLCSQVPGLTFVPSTGGTLVSPSATNIGFGQYRWQFVAGTVAGITVEFTGRLNGLALQTSTASIRLVPGPASITTSTVSASPNTITVGGSTSTITVQLRDAFGNTITDDADCVRLFVTSGPGSVTQVPVYAGFGTGRWTGTYTSTGTPGPVVVSAFLNPDAQPNCTFPGAGYQTILDTAQLNVIPGPAVAAQSFITSTASSVVVGQPVNFRVELRDQFNNPTTNGTVNIAIEDGGGSLTATVGGTIVNTTTGVVTGVTGATFTYTAGTNASLNAVIAARISGTHIVNSPLVIDQVPAAAVAANSTLAVGQTTLQVACPAPSTVVSVQLRDQYGNNTNDLGGQSFTLTSSGPAGFGTITGQPIVSVDANGATTATFVAGTTATISGQITAQLNATNIGGSPTTITQVPGVPFALAIATQPGNGTGGSPIAPQPVIRVVDCNNNTVTADNGRVITAMINSQTSPSLPAGTITAGATAATVNGIASFSNLTIDKIGTYTLSFNASGVASATSGTFIISVGPAAKLGFVVEPTDTRAGDIMTPNVTVEVQDLGGNHVTTSASINLAIGTNPTPGAPGLNIGGGATVPTTTGTAVFTNLSINKAANGYTLYATGFTLGSGSVVLTPSTSATFNIIPNAAAKVAFRVNPPIQTTVGNILVPAPVVEVQDAYGNYVSTTTTISVSIGNNPGGSVLSGIQSITTANGVATFSNLSLDKIGLGYTLVASAQGLLPGSSSAFDIVAGQPVKVVFIAEPSGNNIAAEPFTTQPVVEIQDIGGNRVFTNATVTVSIALNGGTFTSGTLSGLTTLSAVNGRATFSGLSIDKIGNYTLKVTSGSLASDTTGVFTIVTGAPYRLGFYTEPSNGIAGTVLAQQPVVQVQDKGGNHISNNINTPVTLSVASGPGTIVAIDQNPVNTFAGFANFTGTTFAISGCYTIQASASGLVSATSGTFCIVPNVANATTSTLSAPTSVVVGQMTTLTVTRRDRYGNLTTTGTVNLTIVQGGGSLSATTVSGNTVTTNVIYTAGTNAALDAIITAQITGANIVGSPATIDLLPGRAVPATSTIAAASSTVVAGQTVNLTVNMYDQYSNPTTDGTVNLAIQQGGGSLSSSTVTGTTMATVTYTAGTNAAVDAIITAQITGANIVGSPVMIDIIPGIISATTSTVSPTSISVTVGSTASVTVSKRDQYGNPTTNGTVTAAVLNAVAAGGASIAGIVDNGTTATVTYQAGTVAGANIAQIRTLANGVAITPDVQVTQLAGPSVAAQSTLTPTSASVVVGGNAINFTVNKRDIYGNPTTIGSVAVTITDNGTGGATIMSVDNGTTATITYTSGTTAGVNIAQVNARINGSHVQGSPANVTQVPSTVSALTSTITPAGPVTVVVGGNTVTFTVTKRDQYGNLTTTGTVTVAGTNFASGGASISTVDNGTTMTVSFTSGTIAGNNKFQINARVGGTDIINSPILINQAAGAPAQLRVLAAGNPNAPLFDVFSTPPPVLAEASQDVAFPVTLGLVDAYGNTTNANATFTVTIGGTSGATGSFSFVNGASTATTNVTPTTGGSNLTVTFTDGAISATTLTITTVHDALALTYPTPQTLTQFQPAITINPVRTGGRAPFTYSIVAGALPPGLSFNTMTGVISGVPTDTVLLADTTLIRVVDVNGNLDQARIQWKVNPALTIFYATTNTLVVGQAYDIDPVITGGTAPYTFSTVAGSLPAGMGLNATTGRISGIPTSTGTYSVTVKATDVNGASDNANTVIIVVTSSTQPTAVNVKAVLQGAHTGGGSMSTALNIQGLIPTTDPYGQGVTVATVPANVVDWVELEFRPSTNNTMTVADTVGFLLNNGNVVALDGTSQIKLSPASLPSGSYYVVVRHRNHLPIMSSVPVVLSPNSSTQYNFASSQGQAFSSFQLPMIQVATAPDVFAMVSGDENQDGIINATDRVNVRNASGAVGYLSTDLSLDGIVNAVDRVLVRNNTFRATQLP